MNKVKLGLVNSKKQYSDLSKDDFDEIYKSSKDIGGLSSSNNLKKEAEVFEDYYKKNKSKKIKSKSNKK